MGPKSLMTVDRVIFDDELPLAPETDPVVDGLSPLLMLGVIVVHGVRRSRKYWAGLLALRLESRCFRGDRGSVWSPECRWWEWSWAARWMNSCSEILTD